MNPGGYDRPTVVLLHSSASSARQWERLAQLLRPRFLVHAVDFHRQGEAAPSAGRAPLRLADDAARALPLLEGASGAHLVGHSYGAAVALKLAATAPSLVRSVTAYEPVLLRMLIDDDPWSPAAREVTGVARRMGDHLGDGDGPAAARVFVDYWSGAGTWGALGESARAQIALRVPDVLAHFDALTRDTPERAWLSGLPLPMLFLTGERTVAAAQRIGELLWRVFPLARHEILPTMGHMGPITHASAFNMRVARFLDAHAWDGPAPEARCA